MIPWNRKEGIKYEFYWSLMKNQMEIISNCSKRHLQIESKTRGQEILKNSS